MTGGGGAATMGAGLGATGATGAGVGTGAMATLASGTGAAAGTASALRAGIGTVKATSVNTEPSSGVTFVGFLKKLNMGRGLSNLDSAGLYWRALGALAQPVRATES